MTSMRYATRRRHYPNKPRINSQILGEIEDEDADQVHPLPKKKKKKKKKKKLTLTVSSQDQTAVLILESPVVPSSPMVNLPPRMSPVSPVSPVF
jgi:hypothetical protein